MGLQCGRYDTWELNSYWVNEAIAERHFRANPSEIDDRLAWSAKGLGREKTQTLNLRVEFPSRIRRRGCLGMSEKCR
jgi:hypothetical protein